MNNKTMDEYHVWVMMKQRVLNPKNKSYHNYGGRGICIAQEWISDFNCFLNDMGRRPYKHFQLDRIDNDGDYCKTNCRWVSPTIKQLNRGSYKGLLPKGIRSCAKKFKVCINVKGKPYYIGTFDTLAEATKERDLNYKE